MMTLGLMASAPAAAQNPVVQTWFTTDPAPLAVGDRLYVYTGHDEDGADFFWMNEWRVYSTQDMVNWTDHGSPLSLGSFAWADDRAWAAQTIERDGRYYWYVCAHSRLTGGMAIGVAVGDSPTGPFRDALGKPLFDNGSWDNIDPTVMIDPDGQAWLYWGNPTINYCRLNRDMVSIDGDVKQINQTVEGFGAPNPKERQKGVKYRDSYVEGPWIMQAPRPASGYYLLYAAGGVPEHIAYSSAPTPEGPWTYRGEVMPLEDTKSFTNHCGIADFRGHHYFFYHTGKLPGGGGFGRSMAVEEFQYQPDGSLPVIHHTDAGVSPIGALNPYQLTEAETMAWSRGLKTEQSQQTGVYVSSIHNGDYIKVREVDFGSRPAERFTARVASALQGGRIEVRLDSLHGQLIATLDVPLTGGWEAWRQLSTPVTATATGRHDLYFAFRGVKGTQLMTFDWWQFEANGVDAGGCRVEEVTMPCTMLAGETSRQFSICLPEDYERSGRTYPVLYLLHGGGCSHTEWTNYGRLKQQVDSLTRRGEMEPMVIVCAEANEGGRMVWFNDPEWRYEDYFFEELIPYVESHYRIDHRMGQRSVAGFSMGGGGAVGYGLSHPEMFRVVYDMSGYLRRQPLDFLKGDPRGEWRQQNVESRNPVKRIEQASERDKARWRQVSWFVDCGDQDFTLDGNMDFVKALRQAGIPCQMRVKPGAHTWDYWRPALAEALKEVSRSLREECQNPMQWADLPDPDVIRVGQWYYMVTTTMHLMPGAPVMRSRDLTNWETVGYVFDRLVDSPKYDMQQGTVYGRGQWATSLKYHKGRFYALFAPNDQPGGETYIYSAERAEGPWTLVSRLRHFHDASLFFDDDRVYVVYGTGQMVELKGDLSDVISGSERQLFQREADETGLLEGSRMLKHDGRYYLLMISHVFQPGRNRREVCYRADRIDGPYEKRVVLESAFGGFPHAGQGTIVDAEDGRWYGVIFQDRGAVGRVLTLMPCRWRDGWPILGDAEGRIPGKVSLPQAGQRALPLTQSDDFSARRLGLQWQWNHNPDDGAWSLTERSGFLRLKGTRVAPTLYEARNTLTQRMTGPASSAAVRLDLSHLKDGDCAGFAAFNGHSGVLTVRKNGGRLSLEMSEQTVNLSEREKRVEKVERRDVERVDLKQKQVWLRIDGDFLPGRDIARFYYSLDGQQWTRIGTDYQMRFDYRRLFMGTRYAIFYYPTKRTGGYLDIDCFDSRM